MNQDNGDAIARAAAYALVMLGAVAQLVAAPAAAQAWKPEKNVELIIPGGAGGGQDRTARIMQKIMQEGLVPSTITIVNKAGGGGNLAYTYLSQFAGDGHYLATGTATMLTNHILGISPLNYTDFTPVSVLYGEYIGFAVNADGPIQSGRDLADRLRKNPEAVAFAFGTSRGNANHIAVAQLMKAIGGDVTRLKVVIYKASIEATTALMGGHVDVVATPSSTYIPVMSTGKVKIIAIAAPKRMSGQFSGVPTWKEQGVDAVVPSFRMLVAPRGLYRAQIAYWDNVFGRLSQTDEWKKELEANDWENTYLNSADSMRYLDVRYREYRGALVELGLAK